MLAWAVSKRAEPELREATLQNTSLPDDVIEQLAPTLPQALAELVVINQTRLLRLDVAARRASRATPG